MDMLKLNLEKYTQGTKLEINENRKKWYGIMDSTNTRWTITATKEENTNTTFF